MKNILLIKLGAIGDVLRTTSILNGLRERYENCCISWLTKKSSMEVLLNNPLIDEIILFDDNPSELLKKRNFDIIITLDEDREVCEVVRGIEGERVGF